MNIAPLKRVILDLLFPLSCLGCGQEGVWFCSSCRAGLKFLPPACFLCGWAGVLPRTPAGRTCVSCRDKTALSCFLSPFSYGDKMPRELIHALKYLRITPVAPILAGLVRDYQAYYSLRFPSEAVLIPVPLHPKKERVRGFNQSLLIANALAADLGLAVLPGLKKVKSTRPQVELSGEERKKNVEGAFLWQGENLESQSVILVDDVKTTGATLEEAARVLKKAGAKEVWAITVAH